MKRLFTVLVSVLIYISAFAQAPQKMSYQSVIRNSSGTLIANTGVGVKISILQGTASGTVVFAETHSVTTNANGLASLQIGTGTPVTGTLSAVNWAAGPFFIKSETDPAGGTSYTIAGTTELISVPYALYAANSTPGPKGDKGDQGDPGTGVDPGSDTGDMLYWNGTKWATVAKGRDGQILTFCEGKPKWTNDGTCSPFYLGQSYQGGKIFYIDSTGNHGLIAATVDQGAAPWGCKGTLIGGTSFDYGKGQPNTTAIENGCTTAGTAADLCANLVLNGYDDWYLPSKEELWRLKVNQNYVGGFYPGEAHYWSSSEFDANGAWDIVFIWSWDTRHITNKDEIGQVRAIRSF